jgi:hypothetical protein
MKTPDQNLPICFTISLQPLLAIHLATKPFQDIHDPPIHHDGEPTFCLSRMLERRCPRADLFNICAWRSRNSSASRVATAFDFRRSLRCSDALSTTRAASTKPRDRETSVSLRNVSYVSRDHGILLRYPGHIHPTENLTLTTCGSMAISGAMITWENSLKSWSTIR